MDFTVALLVLFTLAHHYIDRAGTAMMLLGGVECQHILQFRQPLRQVALDLGDTVGIAFTLAVQNDHRAHTVAHTIADKPEYLPSCLLHRHTMQVETGLNRILPQPQLAEHPMLNPRALPAQDIMGGQGIHHVRGQRIGIPQGQIHGGAPPLQMPGRHIPWRLHIRAVGLADTPDILHLLEKTQALIFGDHGSNDYGDV